MEENPLRVVITGGPGSGKTTIIKELSKRGYRTFEEISREIIKKSLETDSDVLPWKNLKLFTQIVYEKRVKQYQNCPAGLCFYDRSVIDTLAYLPLDNLEPEPEMEDWIRKNPYHKKVFITPPWREIYNLDSERKEEWKKAVKIYELLCETYERFNYELITVPQYSAEERADFIVQCMNEI